MGALRQLSVIYIFAAGAYTAALALSAHPDWTPRAEKGAAYLRREGQLAAVALYHNALRPGWTLTRTEGEALGHGIARAFDRLVVQRVAAMRSVRNSQVAATTTSRAKHSVRAPSSIVAATSPAAPGVPPTMAQGLRGDAIGAGRNGPARVRMTLAPQAAIAQPSAHAASASLPSPSLVNGADVIRVEQRMKDSLSRELFENFELFLYVSKADAGPWAQRMYVFRKQPSGDLVLLYNWPVSTGREQIEFNPDGLELRTDTPAGYYEFDARRSYEHYRSVQWGKPMPYAMFFDWVKNGDQTGLAIHAATGDDVARLGRRASAGCIHLSLDNARTLFTMIRTQYRGLAPRFAYDRRTGTMSNDGILLHDASGRVRMAQGYKVLIFIEDYGGENVVAALF